MEMLFVLIGFLICARRAIEVDREMAKTDAAFFAELSKLN